MVWNLCFFPMKIFLILYYLLTKYQDQNFNSLDIKDSVFWKSSLDIWWSHKLSQQKTKHNLAMSQKQYWRFFTILFYVTRACCIHWPSFDITWSTPWKPQLRSFQLKMLQMNWKVSDSNLTRRLARPKEVI